MVPLNSSWRVDFKNIEVYGINSIRFEISTIFWTGSEILSPRIVLNIRFRPGKAYLSGMGGISQKIWRHHETEVASSKFYLHRIPSSWVLLDWLIHLSQNTRVGSWSGSHFSWVKLKKKKTPQFSGPNVEKVYSFLSDLQWKTPLFPPFYSRICFEKYSLIHIFVDFDTLIEWSE